MTGITIEHAQIIRWTQNRGGLPAVDRSANHARPFIRFPHEGQDNVVSWEEFLAAFEGGQWAFIYEDRNPEGERSRTWQIIPRFEPASHWTCEIKNSVES
jgi:hypothetical protein